MIQNGSGEVVITFEDLHKENKPIGPLPTGYAECTWSESAWFLTKGCYSSTCMRGQCALLNANGHDLSFQRQDPFYLKGVSLSSLWMDTADVVLEGWAQGVRKYSQTLMVGKNTMTNFDLDYRDIDRVSLTTGGAHIVVDNIILRLD